MSTPQLRSDLAPPPFLQLAGHPVRWRLLGELGRSDRTVQELTGLVGEPQNLVSYHLGKLKAGRLVSARRSAADGRDMYYGLDLPRIGGLLSATGKKIHPGLRLAPPQRDDALAGAEVASARILFLCTGNSARSQMAEALARARSGGALEVVSAGSHPKALHPNAIRAMREGYGIDISDQASKPFTQFAGERFDWIVSLCDLVREACPEFPGGPEAIHWSLPNPATGEPDDVTYGLFVETAAELSTRIDYLIALIAERGPSQGDTDDDQPQ